MFWYKNSVGFACFGDFLLLKVIRNTSYDFGSGRLKVKSCFFFKKRFLIVRSFLPNRFALSMPKTSERGKLLAEVDHLIWLHAINESILDDAEVKKSKEKDARDLLDLRLCICESRYLEPRSYRSDKHSLADQIWEYTERQFKQEVRMDRESFVKLVRILSSHSIFKNKSKLQQTPVWIQCLIVFRRLGCFGNANSLGMNGRTYGFSEGAVVLFVKRVFTSLFSIRKSVVKWPDEEERIQIKERFRRNYGIYGAVGIIDGTPAIFSQKPAIDGETYFSRKGIYCS